MQYFDEVELSAATTLPMPAVNPEAPGRLPVDPFICYAMDGYLRGMNYLAGLSRVSVENFAERLAAATPDDIRAALRNPNYVIPEELWLLGRSLSEEDHAKVVYAMVWHVHLCKAMHLVCVATPEDGDPLETLRGREHLALPLELAGEKRFSELWDGVKKLLPDLGLDRWKKTDFYGNVEYPEVPKRYAVQREMLKRLCHLESHVGMERFLRHPSEAMARVYPLRWPQELSVFYSDDAVLNAIGRYAAVN